jgi:site-specific DNA-methyltransferase (adenine-specific)
VGWGSAGPLPSDVEIGVLPGFYEYASPLKREHVTQKPDGLMRDLLQIAKPGTHILDPFMGSGTTGVAAIQTGRAFTGIELDPVHFETACRRIDAAHRQGVLFEASSVRDEQSGLFGEGA